MDIKYDKTNSRGDLETEQGSIDCWIESAIKDGGIESQIKKLIAVVAIVGEQWLIANPDRVDDIAYAIDSEGHGHKITHCES